MFSFPALLLAAVGIYGVLSQRVAQRTQEIGMRVAPGARRDDLLKLIIGEGLRLTLIGIAVGIAGSLALARFLSSMLYGVTPTDSLTVAAVSCLHLLDQFRLATKLGHKTQDGFFAPGRAREGRCGFGC
jgi:putative ABC transport system permease protein